MKTRHPRMQRGNRAEVENSVASETTASVPDLQGNSFQGARLSLLGRAALAYADRGFPVFKLVPGTRSPFKGSRGFYDATTDADRIVEMWADDPDANIGGVSGERSGVWMLDIDPPDGFRSLEALIDQFGPLPVTATAQTPRGGEHRFFRYPETGPGVKNSTGKIGDGLDVKGERAQLVMAPSRRPDGSYKWIKNGATGFARAPDAWLKLVAPPPPPRRSERPSQPLRNCDRYVSAAVNGELRDLDAAVPSQRNHALNRAAYCIAGFVKAGAVPEDWARAELHSHALAIGLSAWETNRTIASAFAAAPARQLA